MTGGRFKRFFLSVALYAGIIVGTLALVDLLLIALGLFPPRYTYGHPVLGWVAAEPTGRMQETRCIDYSTGDVRHYMRNEDAIRTALSARQLLEDSTSFKIAVGGDSQTELCAPNAGVHFGVMEQVLRERGVPATVFAYGAGKYSPLQAYLALREPVARYGAHALVLNFYTGNDVYDMLRLDDRPHLVRSGAGYQIAPPIWYQEFPPGRVYRSRVMSALRSIGQATGIRNVSVRLRYLRHVAEEQGKGLSEVLAYMNDLRKSASGEIGYPAAFSAQMLNQQLFFHRFPGSRAESINRVRALLELVRAAHPDLLLVLSPLPSYQLVQQQPVAPALLRVIERLPISYEQGVREEGQLYEALRRLAAETGWLFVDNLRPLKAYSGPQPLFNDFDYHLLPVASAIIGRAQANAIANRLRERRR